MATIPQIEHSTSNENSRRRDPASFLAQRLKWAEERLQSLVLQASTAGDEQSPEFIEANEQVRLLERKFIQAVPTTLDGLLAKARYLKRHTIETCPLERSDDHVVLVQTVDTVLEGLEGMARLDSVR